MYSIIICSVDDRRFETVGRSLAHALDSQPHELIRIPDARSLCEGYNRGLVRARGDRLIFCHDDIEILSEDFAERLDANFARFDVFGLIGTTRLITGTWYEAGRPDIHGSVVHPAEDGNNVYLCMSDLSTQPVDRVQAVDGMFIGASRRAAEHLRWDEAHVPGFHLYDIDFSYRAYLAGMRVGVAADILVVHDSSGRYDATWAAAFAAFNQRYATHLSKIPGTGAGPYKGPCADKHEAYGHFRRQMRSEDGNAR